MLGKMVGKRAGSSEYHLYIRANDDLEKIFDTLKFDFDDELSIPDYFLDQEDIINCKALESDLLPEGEAAKINLQFYYKQGSSEELEKSWHRFAGSAKLKVPLDEPYSIYLQITDLNPIRFSIESKNVNEVLVDETSIAIAFNSFPDGEETK